MSAFDSLGRLSYESQKRRVLLYPSILPISISQLMIFQMETTASKTCRTSQTRSWRGFSFYICLYMILSLWPWLEGLYGLGVSDIFQLNEKLIYGAHIQFDAYDMILIRPRQNRPIDYFPIQERNNSTKSQLRFHNTSALSSPAGKSRCGNSGI